MWKNYLVTLKLNNIAGGVPLHPDMIEAWISSQCKEATDAEREKIKNATIESLPEVADEKVAKTWRTFKRLDGNLCIEARCIKAMLKEASNIRKDNIGIKNLKSKVAERVFVKGVSNREFVPLLDAKRNPITEPSRTDQLIFHGITAQGPRTSLIRLDVVDDAFVQFVLKILDDSSNTNKVPFEAVQDMIEYAQEGGLGSARSQGYGTFEIVEIKSID